VFKIVNGAVCSESKLKSSTPGDIMATPYDSTPETAPVIVRAITTALTLPATLASKLMRASA
jgi:hypothetical protein